MKLGKSIAILAALGGAATAVLAVVAHAGGDKVAFPANIGARYGDMDRANKQYVEFFISPPAALEAAKKGTALPSGTVITMVQYATKRDAQDNPEKDASGRYIKTNLTGYAVMEKRTGWGTEYPDAQRNGEWEYQAFKADKTPNTAANLTACFNCHKPLPPGQDFVFTYDRLKAAR
jgi:hypothetical protein